MVASVTGEEDGTVVGEGSISVDLRGPGSEEGILGDRVTKKLVDIGGRVLVIEVTVEVNSVGVGGGLEVTVKNWGIMMDLVEMVVKLVVSGDE